MKKLFISLIVLCFAASAAFAAPYTQGDDASATFECKVIAPLVWNSDTEVELEEVVAGVSRTVNTPIHFTLTGEPGYFVEITTVDPVADLSNPTTTVSLTGAWTGSGAQELVSGTNITTYTVNDIVSTSTNDHGTYKFTISVSAKYTGL